MQHERGAVPPAFVRTVQLKLWHQKAANSLDYVPEQARSCLITVITSSITGRGTLSKLVEVTRSEELKFYSCVANRIGLW